MLIILCLYFVALRLLFSKFKVVRWGWLSGTISVFIGALILATFLALFNYLAPSGKVTVTGRVVEVTPNVSGQIVAIPVKPNVPVKMRDVLFQIDPAPFQFKVNHLRAALAGAQQQARILKSSYEQATANVAGLEAQVKFNAKRLKDIRTLSLTVGDRALQARSAMSFVVEDEITIIGMFSQNGFQTIKVDAPVDIVFDNVPGRVYHAKITAIPKGVGQGQVAVSGTLARTTSLGGATAFPAEISVPDEMSRDSLRLGMSGNATAFAEKADVIGLLASILVRVSSYTAYLQASVGLIAMSACPR
jgi:multidrug resistance efflux pump